MSEVKEKPNCKLIGTDGNVFAIIGLVTKTLKNAKQFEEAKEFQSRAFNASSYDDVLAMLFDYVTIDSVDREDDDEEYDPEKEYEEKY